MKPAGGAEGGGEAPGRLGLSAFRGRRGWQFGVLGAALTLIVFLGFLALGVAELGQDMPALPIDFAVFWGTAKLAVAGEWAAAFDVGRLMAAHGAPTDEWLPWLYPPGLMVLLAPLGLLDFAGAWIVFSAVSVVAVALAVRSHAGGVTPVWLAFAFAPAWLPAMLIGQVTLLWVAGLLAALAAMRADRPVLAGVLIGCLTLKPQLGLLIPVALVASRQWTAIAAATATALLVALGPTLLFGAEYWPLMMDAGRELYATVIEQAPEAHLLSSLYGGLRAVGLAHEAAIALQWTATGLAALVVRRAWRDEAAGFDLRAAVLLTAIPITTPYLFFYDTAFLAPAALFLLRAGVLRAGAAGGAVLGLLWIGAGPACVADLLTPGIDVPVRGLVLPVMVLAFTLAAGAVLRHRAGACRAAA